MVTVARVAAREHEEALYAFFAAQRFMGLHNARRVYRQAQPDLSLARDDAVLVGVLLAVEEERGGGARACVENCLVAEGYRRRGIGARLMGAAEAHYRRRGLIGMEFAVRRGLEAYESLLRSGYAVVRVYFKDVEDWEGNPLRGQERHVVRKDF